MSPNRFDLETALQELGEERPSPERRARSWEALRTPRSRSLRVLGLVAAASLSVLLLVLPSRTNALTWDEVVKRMEGSPRLHLTYFDANGKLTGEMWRDGPDRCTWLKDENGRIKLEDRSGRKNFYTYLYHKPQTPNAYQYATLWNQVQSTRSSLGRLGGPGQTVDALLGKGRGEVLKQEQSELDGRPVQRYELLRFGSERQVVFCDQDTGRILLIETAERHTIQFEYPTKVDPNWFSFEYRFSRDVPVLDLRGKEDPRKTKPEMPKVIAAKGNIQLREVSLTPEGDLYFVWTGSKEKPKLPGIRLGQTRGPANLADAARKPTPLIWYRVALPERIGNQVTLVFPKAVFKNIPIERLPIMK